MIIPLGWVPLKAKYFTFGPDRYEWRLAGPWSRSFPRRAPLMGIAETHWMLSLTKRSKSMPQLLGDVNAFGRPSAELAAPTDARFEGAELLKIAGVVPLAALSLARQSSPRRSSRLGLGPLVHGTEGREDLGVLERVVIT